MARLAVLGAILCTNCAREGIDAEALRDPAACAACHPDHTREWAGSMHAYASDDPVFLALERLGQRATDGALGTLCVGCHAPAAIADGATRDQLDLDALPRRLRGVGCWACHSIDGVTEIHNGMLERADDGVMRGRGGAIDTPGHDSASSPWLDGDDLRSSEACGACHDVVLGNGVAIERTYGEWAESLFGPSGVAPVSCATCHMMGRDGLAADVAGAPVRRLHDHGFPGVDQALTPWPEREAQNVAIARDLRAALISKLCVVPSSRGAGVSVTLDNLQVGHAFPSGVTHARRVWVEVEAWAGDTELLHRGNYAPGEVVRRTDDPTQWVFGSTFRDQAGDEVPHVWEAEAIESELLPASVTLDATDPRYYHARTRTWDVPLTVDRVDVAVHLEPIGLDILDDLIAAGELAPEVRAAMTRRTLTTLSRSWTRDAGWGCVP